MEEKNMVQERVSEKPVIDIATRSEFMYFLDKEGYVARSPYASNKLSPEEKAKREAEAKEKTEAYQKRLQVSKENKKSKLLMSLQKQKDAIAKKEEELKKLGV